MDSTIYAPIKNGANLSAITIADGRNLVCYFYITMNPHVFVNGYCACGRPAPTPETEAPGNDTEVPAPVVEDGVTSEEVAKMWKHVCRHHR